MKAGATTMTATASEAGALIVWIAVGEVLNAGAVWIVGSEVDDADLPEVGVNLFLPLAR